MWSTSHDRRVRDSHKELNGRVFTWDNPPIVDPARGRRAHPGQDYGCRCVAVPVMARQLKEVA
jgi:SPP1 gp7 family putative phage head morphogenesis protein